MLFLGYALCQKIDASSADLCQASIIVESRENSSSKQRDNQDGEKVAALAAWHRVDSRTREALRRCCLTDLIINGYEECVRSFVKETGHGDVLDAFHRLLLHGVCVFYNVVSSTVTQWKGGKMTRIRKKRMGSKG